MLPLASQEDRGSSPPAAHDDTLFAVDALPVIIVVFRSFCCTQRALEVSALLDLRPLSLSKPARVLIVDIARKLAKRVVLSSIDARSRCLSLGHFEA